MMRKLFILFMALFCLSALSAFAFTVHFLDVGQADAALVLCEGESMLIDGGNAADSNLIYSVLKKEGIKHLDYIVCTHAHEDHVGGLAGALNYASVDKALCPVTDYDSKAFRNFKKYLDKQNVPITVPSVGDTFALGSSQVEIVGVDSSAADANNTSIVLRVIYGNTAFLFSGDAERAAEEKILGSGCELSSTVLKVGHHGSETSTSYPYLREVMPQYAVISVGKDNSYGHPAEATLSRLRDADVTVYRTDMQGDIVCTSDGTSVSFSTAKNGDLNTLAAVGNNSVQNKAVEQSYMLNTNTKKFHIPSCSSVKQMKEKNKKEFTGSREDVIQQGYSPCGNCQP